MLIRKLNSDVDGGVLLRTCNRMEFYTGSGYADESIVRHLFRVVSGLESGLIGETGIQGQVKNAYLSACLHQKPDASIHRLFQAALRVGKLVRSRTGLSRGAMSHSQATVDLLRQRISNLSDLSITILGVHNMNSNLLHHLTRAGASSVFVGNRTFSKASELAAKYNARAFNFSMLAKRLSETNVLVTATSAPHYVVTLEKFPLNRPMLIFDLAVPFDVDPEIGYLPNIELFNIRNVESAVEQNLELRKAAVGKAESLVEEQVMAFMASQEKRFSRNGLLQAV